MLAVVAAVTLAFGLAPAADATSRAHHGAGSPDAATAVPTPAAVPAAQPPAEPMDVPASTGTSAEASVSTQTSSSPSAGSASPSAGVDASAPRLRLVVFEQDIVLVAARGFPVQAPIELTATATGLRGSTTTRTDADGRLIVGFLLPAGYDGSVTVTATSGPTSATSTLAVTVPTAAPHATTSPSTASSAPTPSSPMPSPSTSSPASPSAPSLAPGATPAATAASSEASPAASTPVAPSTSGAPLAATGGGAPQPVGPVSPGGRGWKLVLGDDFDGTALDRTKWQLCNPSFRSLCLPWNNEKEIFNTAATDNANVRVADGALHLSATRDAGGQIHSGMVSTGPWPASFGPAPAGYQPFSYTYGYYEGRVRIPRGNGFWPSMWQLPAGTTGGAGWPDTGEMDVFEIPGNNPSEYHFTAHWGGGGGECGHPCSPQQATISDASAGWHVFGLDWEPDGLTWYVDGKKMGRTVSDPGAVKNTPFYVIANFSVGGSWGPLGGGVDASTPFPASMDIDYLRVYQRA
ncbi:family 16 glycosylhydrolase [Frankia sp. R82]|uniref:glycoside hydrolase family 16 protein n=1 Tax=Frankia sp. R82 TaxID=2950553 RepID=UPI002043CE3E|nr:glycoside hydrolase family 16 protein [Frankia sp. R82]MCM3882878.1 glycoside hydrolase family 16 protein [Frankia sp. R82]